MGWMVDGVGRLLAHYLEKPVQGYEPFTPSDPDALRATLQPGDVLLVEGNNHISGVIKYLTQSTWSHAALYVGPLDGHNLDHLLPVLQNVRDSETGPILVAALGYAAAPMVLKRKFGPDVTLPLASKAKL